MNGTTLSLRRYSQRLVVKKICETVDKNVVHSPVKDINIPDIPIHELIFGNIKKWPNKVALECLETGRKYTYNDLYSKSTRISYFLRKLIKLKENDAVAIILPNIPEYPLITLGTFQANLKIVTINPKLSADEISRQLALTKPKIVFTLSSLGPKISGLVKDKRIVLLDHNNCEDFPVNTINFQETLKHNGQFLETNPDVNRTAVLLSSSGTTGLPKAVELTHKNIVSNLCQMSCPEFKIGNEATENHGEVVAGILPFFHVFGFVAISLYRTLTGCRIVAMPTFGFDPLIKLFVNHQPTVANLVPSLITMMAKRPDVKPEYLQNLSYVTTGSAPQGLADQENFVEKALNAKVLAGYGMTETSPLTIHQTLGLENGHKKGSTGLVLPNTEIKIVEIDGSTFDGLGPNESGELWVRGPQVMKGYFENEEATKNTITEDGWIKSGDIAQYDETGNIYITGRYKELIKVKGFQVPPAELETLLRTHPSIEEAAVIGIPHPICGEVPKAFVVKRRGLPQLTEKEVQEFVATRVTKYKELLGGVVFLDKIPKNALGKILRNDLKKL